MLSKRYVDKKEKIKVIKFDNRHKVRTNQKKTIPAGMVLGITF